MPKLRHGRGFPGRIHAGGREVISTQRMLYEKIADSVMSNEAVGSNGGFSSKVDGEAKNKTPADQRSAGVSSLTIGAQEGTRTPTKLLAST